VVSDQKRRDPSTSLRAGFGTEGLRERKGGKQLPAFNSQLPALPAERAAFLAPSVPLSFGPLVPATLLFDHGTIVLRMGEMIGKLGRDQRSGGRDQKKNELWARWTAFEAAGELDNKR
jgi:hypothetical protein